MEGNFWKTWMVVGGLSFFGTTSLPHTKPLTYEKVVALAVAIYNSKAGEDCVYRLLEAFAEPQWDPISESHQELNFTIKETMCLVEDEEEGEEVEKKEEGKEEENQAKNKEKEEKKEEEKDQPQRVKRFLRVFKKLKKGIQKLFKKKKIVTRPLTS
ncbi:putative Cathelicidin-related peptide Oh-Cath protein [Naja naja]|nr:putative Cathelicidin-related peptide Oh-Cath protein [Naja naja]